MFIKKSSPKAEKVKICSALKKCRSCGKPFVPECKDGSCDCLCPLCKQKQLNSEE